MEGYISRPPFKLQQIAKTGDQEKFLVRVKSTSGGNGLPYDEFVLSISDTRLAIWKSKDTAEPIKAAEKLTTMVVELHGTAAKFAENYFFNSDNTDSASSVDEVVEQMQNERVLDKFIDTRS